MRMILLGSLIPSIQSHFSPSFSDTVTFQYLLLRYMTGLFSPKSHWWQNSRSHLVIYVQKQLLMDLLHNCMTGLISLFISYLSHEILLTLHKRTCSLALHVLNCYMYTHRQIQSLKRMLKRHISTHKIVRLHKYVLYNAPQVLNKTLDSDKTVCNSFAYLSSSEFFQSN